jgi:uncharacterized SAM-binding protein YcdF (DUF218 family)
MIRLLLRIFILSIVLLLLLIAFSNAGYFLVKDDEIDKSDAIIILMGSIPDRVLTTYDLYNDGFSNKVLIPSDNQFGCKPLERYGIHIPTSANLSKSALVQLGIADSNIQILSGSATSTNDEARIVANFLLENCDYDTLLLVSSSPHLKRASLIFDDIFDKNNLDIHLICVPSKYTSFKASNWWTDRESAKQVFFEYLKLSNYLLFEQW